MRVDSMLNQNSSLGSEVMSDNEDPVDARSDIIGD